MLVLSITWARVRQVFTKSENMRECSFMQALAGSHHWRSSNGGSSAQLGGKFLVTFFPVHVLTKPAIATLLDTFPFRVR
jgi:hypothetical protein